jgi:hypothetical protein
MIKRLLLFTAFFYVCGISIAQTVDRCGSVAYMEYLKATKPEAYKQIMEFQQQLTAHQQQRSLRTSTFGDTLIRIPVVVHVIHNNAAGTIGGANNPNISDAQILSQIKVLNDDYQRLNADSVHTPSMFKSVAANVKLQFCLANVDPNGLSTSGITRSYFNQSIYDAQADVDLLSSISYWPSDQYLNIWVCNLGTSTLGSAQSPGSGVPGLSSTDGAAETDGVVINFKAFGTTGTLFPKYTLGRTATHEVGHWFGLFHPWGSGANSGDCSKTDYCDDTPTCGNSFYSSYPACSMVPTGTGAVVCTPARMIQNYMEYSDDACMNLFTEDQKTRMRSSIELSARRAALLNSLGCCTLPALKKLPLVKDFEDGDLNSGGWILLNPNSSSTFTPGFEISSYSGYGEGNYGTAVTNDSIYMISDPATHKYMFSMVSPFVNIQNTHTPVLRFDWAYSPLTLNGNTDSIVVYVSTGCDNSWAELKTFYGSDFSSTQNPRADFIPAANEWITTEVNLGNYVNSPALRVKFVSYSKGINTFYLDNINFGFISNTLDVTVYPNPTSGQLTVQTIFSGTKNVDYLLYNTLGQLVYQAHDQNIYSSNKVLDLSFLASGVYFILVSDGDEKIVKRIVKQ